MNTYNFTYIISLLLIFFGCNQNIDGCLDAQACNYDPDANTEDGSCEYPEENFDCDGNCVIGEDCNGECGGDAVEDFTSDWNIQIIASMQPWNILDTIFDENNILGVSDSASDDFDSMDIPEPPSSPDPNWISGYFYHPEWDSIFGDHYTQEYKSNQFCGTKEWDFIVKANSPGPMELFFIFNNVPDSVQISLVGEESTIISDSLVVSSVLEENVPKEFLIKVNIN